MAKRVAIIQFPGSNCEYETERAVRYYGLDTAILRWNCDETHFRGFDAYVLPGGFSYQDRVRAGVMASKLPIMSWLIDESQQGKPVLGICNGCQILAELGLVMDIDQTQSLSVSLSSNRAEGREVGFICDWVYVSISQPESNLFTRYFTVSDIIPIPVNHGEGSFFVDPDYVPQLDTVTTLRYCTSSGELLDTFPVNPNGSQYNLAGLSNNNGNVLALMPHPERAGFLKQIPSYVQGDWMTKRDTQLRDRQPHEGLEEGPWSKLFIGLKEFLN